MKSTLLEISLALSTCCLLLGAMMSGNPYSSSMYLELSANLIVGVAVVGIAISAFIMAGYRRAFCVGFCVSSCLYALSLAFSGSDDFELNSRPRHPVSVYLRALYMNIGRDVALDSQTMEEIKDYKMLTLRERQERPQIIHMKLPLAANFLYFAHLLAFLSIGYCGGNFGRWAYWYETKKGRTKE